MSRFRAIALVGALLMFGACVGQARTDTSYGRKAASTVATVRASVETASLLAASTDRHHLPATYLSVVLGEAEDDASAAAGTFSSIQSPSARSDEVRARTLDAITPAIDALARMRILVRRGEVGLAMRVAAVLPRIVRALDSFAAGLD